MATVAQARRAAARLEGRLHEKEGYHICFRQDDETYAEYSQRLRDNLVKQLTRINLAEKVERARDRLQARIDKTRLGAT